jgi:hypothetical protein
MINIENNQSVRQDRKRTSNGMRDAESIYSNRGSVNETSLDNTSDFELNECFRSVAKNTHKPKKAKLSNLVRKKTFKEVAFLEQQFTKDPNWTRASVQICKKALTNLRTDQIYKWGFDKKTCLTKNMDKTDPLSSKMIGSEVRKEVYAQYDLNEYVLGIVTWFDKEFPLPSLNSLAQKIAVCTDNPKVIRSDSEKDIRSTSVCNVTEIDVSKSVLCNDNTDNISIFTNTHESQESLFEFSENRFNSIKNGAYCQKSKVENTNMFDNQRSYLFVVEEENFFRSTRFEFFNEY